MPWFDLKGDARLGRCTTDNCGGQPTSRLEAHGVGSNYCSGCRAEIEASDRRHAQEVEAEYPRVCETHGTRFRGLCGACHPETGN